MLYISQYIGIISVHVRFSYFTLYDIVFEKLLLIADMYESEKTHHKLVTIFFDGD